VTSTAFSPSKTSNLTVSPPPTKTLFVLVSIYFPWHHSSWRTHILSLCFMFPKPSLQKKKVIPSSSESHSLWETTQTSTPRRQAWPGQHRWQVMWLCLLLTAQDCHGADVSCCNWGSSKGLMVNRPADSAAAWDSGVHSVSAKKCSYCFYLVFINTLCFSLDVFFLCLKKQQNSLRQVFNT
jgi:hypothetical protein